MEIMLSGFVLFIGVHLIPSLPGTKDGLTRKLGVNGYKGSFALVSLIGMVLIVMGIGGVEWALLWAAPVWGRALTLSAMPFVIILLCAAQMPCNIKRFIRHPMLWSVVLWSMLHLTANGDLASTILFVGFALFSIIMIILINSRDPKPEVVKVPWFKDVIVLAVGGFIYMGILHSHQYFTGVPIT